MDIETKSFADFLKYFSRRKNNLLRQSNQTAIKRLYILTLDLSAQPSNSGNNSVTPNGNILFKVPSNFTGLHIQQIYSTSTPTTLKSGQIYLSFDDNNIGNIQNSKLLQSGDSFDMIDGEVANGWLWWNNQTDTSISIAFFIDMDYRAGGSNVNVLNGVNVSNTQINPLYNRIPYPAGFNLLTCANGTSFTYTIPTNFFAKVSAMCYANGAGSNSGAFANTGAAAVPIVTSAGTATINFTSTIAGLIFPAGTVISGTSTTNALSTAHVELYPST